MAMGTQPASAVLKARSVISLLRLAAAAASVATPELSVPAETEHQPAAATAKFVTMASV
jgi:hypothetical protein